MSDSTVAQKPNDLPLDDFDAEVMPYHGCECPRCKEYLSELNAIAVQDGFRGALAWSKVQTFQGHHVKSDHPKRRSLDDLVKDFNAVTTWHAEASAILRTADAARSRVLERMADALHEQGLTSTHIHALASSRFCQDEDAPF